MVGKVLDITNVLTPDNLGSEIANQWTTWNNLRSGWIEKQKELRNYLYATDTTTTGNALLPWSNTTTTPKLTQIADNLHANYFSTLFPQNKWMRWEALDRESGFLKKKENIQAYMDNKLRQSNFTNEASRLVQDYIHYGNCFATVVFDRKYSKKADGVPTIDYIGPRMVRISPFDIVFNPTSNSFTYSPKIIKSMVTLGEIAKMIKENPENDYYAGVFRKMNSAREQIKTGGADATYNKSEGFTADGFSSIQHYYGSNYVEILTFYGDIYDPETGILHENRIITVVDRAYVLDNKENPSWSGRAPIFHAGWRERPDNLYAMGPLDNLVGMQYRIDHLENLKADVFDQIAYPVQKIRGQVEDYDFAPGTKIIMGEEGDVTYLVPDATALNADLQISVLENKMEEMAGAPRQAMGIRTPGEKTAFEVQTLQNSASRIFEHKCAHLERTFFEPVLNAMLEEGRRNFDMNEQISFVDSNSGATLFTEITKEDISGNGKIVPVGARHFAERARRVQNLTTLWQVKNSDPTVVPHLSGKEFARILAEELGEPTLFGENISVHEQAETQMAAMDKQVETQDKLAISQQMGM